MTYVVTENCIKCKYMDCVEVCPVDCFYEENMLVINPDECIDCGVCEPECPAEAIVPDTEDGLDEWLEINTKFAAAWLISHQRRVPADADEWKDAGQKADLSEAAGAGSDRVPAPAGATGADGRLFILGDHSFMAKYLISRILPVFFH